MTNKGVYEGEREDVRDLSKKFGDDLQDIDVQSCDSRPSCEKCVSTDQIT